MARNLLNNLLKAAILSDNIAFSKIYWVRISKISYFKKNKPKGVNES